MMVSKDNNKIPFIEKAEILHIKHPNTKDFLLAARYLLLSLHYLS